jgi:glutaredoxin
MPKYFNATGKNWLVFSKNLDSTKSLNNLKKIKEFYREVVKCWNLSDGGQTKSPVIFIDIRKHIIWGNKHITFENKPIVFENWIKSHLIYVNDILDDTKTLSS